MFRKAKKEFKKGKRGIRKASRTPFTPLVKHSPFSMDIFEPLTKPVISPAIKKVVKGTEKAGKFIVKPSNLVIEGEIAEVAGDILIPLGGVTGQPELVAAGIGLKAGGKKVKQFGKVAQKVEKVHEQATRPKQPVGPSLQDIMDILGGLKEVSDHPELPSEGIDKFEKELQLQDTHIITRVDNLSRTLRKDQEIIEKEESIIKQEEDIIEKAVDTINELSDRLDEQQSPKTFSELLRLSGQVNSLDKMDFLNRNWNKIRDFKEEDIFEIFTKLNIRG